MRLLLLSPTVDTAGLGIGVKRAFDAHGGEWTARHVRTADSWLRYPADIEWDRGSGAQTREVERLYAEADLVIIIERPEAASWFAPRGGLVVWHLGTWYRRSPALLHEQCRAIGALEVVDMHDLMRFGVTEWLPDVIDPEPLAALRAEVHRDDGRIRIAHAPTDRALKSTDLIAAAVGRVMARHPEAEFDIIERVPNAECLERKARCDIFVDELTLGYGLNALECWAMGIPVVSGIADPATANAMRRDFGGGLPFMAATPASLEARIEELVTDRELRAAVAADGAAALAAHHTPEAVVRRITALHERMAAAA